MADLISFQLYDNITGDGATTATPTFLHYKDRTGTPRTAPVIVHVSNGVFAFSPSVDDVSTGVSWVVDSGVGVYPNRYVGSIYAPDAPFLTAVYTNGSGAVTDISGSPPTLAFYKSRAGVDLTPLPPLINAFGGYLWTMTPSALHAAEGVVFDLVSTTANPSHLAGDLLAETVTINTTTVVVAASTAGATATTTPVITPFAPSGITSTATGIFQSDLCIQHGLIEGMAQLRSTPWLLDSVTRNITFDPLTSRRYGQKELDQLKRWFLNTEIPVIPYRMGGPVAPSVSLALVSSNIDASTLGDVHYDEQEDVGDGGTYIVAGPLNPTYNGSTGVMTLPPHLFVDVFTGMVVMDAKGQEWRIGEILSNVAPVSFQLATGILAPFERCTIRGAAPNVIETHESVKMKEAWSLGCHVNTEPGHLLFLHAIITFILLWGKETLFEGRGFELSDFSSTDFARNQAYDEEQVWTRFINLNGITQSVWPKRRLQKIVGVKTVLKITGGEHVPDDFGDVDDLAWIGDQDSLGE